MGCGRATSYCGGNSVLAETSRRWPSRLNSSILPCWLKWMCASSTGDEARAAHIAQSEALEHVPNSRKRYWRHSGTCRGAWSTRTARRMIENCRPKGVNYRARETTLQRIIPQRQHFAEMGPSIQGRSSCQRSSTCQSLSGLSRWARRHPSDG